MAWQDRYSTELAAMRQGESVKDWPTTHAGIVNEYNRREESLLGLAYRLYDVQRLGLFRALDSSDRETMAARRLVRDLIYVVQVDAASIASDTLAIDAPGGLYAGGDEDPERIGDIALAETLWRESGVYEQAHQWALMFCTLGDWAWEAIATPEGPRIVAHDPRSVRVQRDPLGMRITQAVITIQYPAPLVVDADGRESGGDQWHTYKRVLTPTEVRVYIDDELQPDESGPHNLGVVPLTLAAFQPVHGKTLSMGATHGMEDAISVVDSMLTQLMAIGTRHANPILKVLNATLGAEPDLQAIGRTVELPNESDLQWLEASLQGLKTLADTAGMLRDMIRDTAPEFLFMDSGANASGTALSYRAQAFVNKIEPVRQRWYAALSRVTGYAMAMARGVPWSEDDHTIIIDGGDALTVDRGASASLFAGLAADGFMTRRDAVAKLQGLGLVDEDEDSAEYAAQALVESRGALGTQMDELRRLVELMAMLNAGGTLDDVDDQPEPAPGDNLTADV